MTQRIARLTAALFLGSVGLTALMACSNPVEPALEAEALPPVHASDDPKHSRFAPQYETAEGEPRVSFQTEIVPILKQHCAGCHSTGGAGPVAVEMFTATGQAQHGVVQSWVGPILLEIQTGRMPAGKPYSVPDEQFRLLDVWAASGAPDN